jgi:hypothetical protein
MLLKDCSACYSCAQDRHDGVLQMNCDALAAQIIDSQHTADYVPPQVVEDQHFPHWLAIFCKEGVDLILRSCGVVAGAFGGSQIMIQT